MIDNPERFVERLGEIREDLLPILVPELLHLGLIAVETEPQPVRTFGEYLLPNLWVNRNEGTRAYYETMWHDGRSYVLIEHYFHEFEKSLDSEVYYDAYERAVKYAIDNPDRNCLFTMCEFKAWR